MADSKADAAPTGDKPSAGKSKIAVIGLVSVVVLFETGMFFFLVPSAEEISALAEARLVQSVQQSEEESEKKAIDDDKVIEFPLGVFGETFSPNESERQFRVEMRLFGLVKLKDESALKAEFAAKEGRLRHAIGMKIRNSELAELKENQLGLLQRHILTKCNHLIEGDLLLGIGFNDYQLIEE